MYIKNSSTQNRKIHEPEYYLKITVNGNLILKCRHIFKHYYIKYYIKNTFKILNDNVKSYKNKKPMYITAAMF